ncbi:NEL-type E3 ubiquitin ligase domain-containing protein [Pseudomonas sp. 18175]|uniref:NEL-type E3 ubiquitin ligase domain-containing protein n=1 Tax=Pseudomonas sp. 18175 TaxID=3390056 RepID=UPI003D1AEB43
MADLPSATPAATLSIHRDYLERSSPPWLVGTTSARREHLKAAPVQPPDWYLRATPQQQKTLNDTYTASFTAQSALDKAFATLQDIDSFAEPLLVKALSEQFNVQLDVHKTILQLRTEVEVRQPAYTLRTFDIVRLPLLQAALHNFEEWECKAGAFHASSGFVVATAQGDAYEKVSTTLTVVQFTGLCRSLDIGAQYQRYLKAFMYPEDSTAEQALRHKFSAARKADLAAAAEQALLTQDIGPEDYQMITSVINGQNHPWMGTRQVWFRDLELMRKRLTGCMAFVICEKYHYTRDLILYIPHDPHHPLKRVTADEFQAIFKQRFTERDASTPDDGSPTAYHRFFSRFVRYGDLPGYFDELTVTTPAPGATPGLKPYSPLLNDFLRGLNPFSLFAPVLDVPPDPAPIRRLNPTPYLGPSRMNQKGVVGWEDNLDLWTYLFDQHRDKLLADARSHAVPTADVDARVRSEKFAKLLGIGMLALNVVSMFVPVLGEVMMVVMAGQLLYETLEGSIEWAEGDRRAAKAHLVDVAENLAFIALMAVGGKVLSKVIAAKPTPQIEGLAPVTLPNGQTRLWKPDLSGYESPVTLPANVVPNAQGQYLYQGKTYIRQAGKFYEKTLDPSLGRWRIQHPTDPSAYQPVLSHNGVGAWRYSLERPQDWDRLTLMQRLGPMAQGFTDEQLLNMADISGVSDDALRKMHVDNAAPPPELADTLRLFRADQDVAQVLEQVSSGRAVDGRYLYTLALVTEMPRWPAGRVLEVFDGPGFTGNSQRYGVERLYPGAPRKPRIRITRADVVTSQLPAHILAALDESEIVGLLGGEAARVRENRPQELRTQLADYARTRQPALFDSLYTGTERPDPAVAKLQRLYPGLSEDAAQSVLAHADLDELARFHRSGRVPLGMEELARWHVRQGRMGRAYAGLHMENLTSADSKRLALHTLGKLPGWSDALRLEVRDGNVNGALLDSIGSETAQQRKYLVKRGPQYQAFNERGEALNSHARYGDNFYASLMHALPDETRQALGLPHVGQSLDLRRVIIDYAATHPLESTQIVEDAPARQGWFKPPQRIAPNVLGYPASGRGEGAWLLLANRAQALYPEMSEAQAEAFVRSEELGRGHAGVFTLLENSRREWEQLQTTLETWMAAESDDPFAGMVPTLDPRPRMAQALKRCWQRRLLSEFPRYDELVLDGDVALPALNADFSHVRTLTLRGSRLISGNVGQMLGNFPGLQGVTLAGVSSSLEPVLGALESLPGLSRLHIESSSGLLQAEQLQLERLTQLQELNLGLSGRAMRALDLSRMRKLRSLTLSGLAQWAFPSGVFDLPELQTLDLGRANINALPAQLFDPANERLWAGLSVKWSKLSREHFKAAFNYVKNWPAHLLYEEEMVRDYCTGRFYEHLGRPVSIDFGQDVYMRNAFFTRWPSAQAQFNAMEALTTEYGELAEGLDTWVSQAAEPVEQHNRAMLATELRGTWYRGLFSRYEVTHFPSLELSALNVSELPRLPEEGFAHVTQLRVQNSQVPAAQLNAFIRGFKFLRTLDANGCGLTQWTVAPGEWPQLRKLDLGNNPLVELDVSGLSQLQAVNLRGSALPTWPTGAEQLPELEWLDLRNTRLTELPDTVLAHDRILLDTQLSGVPLTPEAQSALATARHRIEHRLGLSQGTLSVFEQRPVGDGFPPVESGSSLTELLVPLPAPVDDALPLVQQLQQLHPTLGDEGAGQWLERLRSEGLTDPQIRERISAWEQAADGLTRRLNGWVFTRRFSLGPDMLVTANTRQLAAETILARWRDGVAGVSADAGRELSFYGMTLGELPELGVTLESIGTLNLNGVQISAQGSNAFLRAFPKVQTLVLSSNPLATLPDALAGLTHLTRLELSAVGINDAEHLYATLVRLEQLQYLDLSYCDLGSFRVDQFDRLHTLNLSNNELTEWPQGALTAPALRRLDLSSNGLESIPPGALEGAHDTLMAGVDLSDNFHFSMDDLNRLQAYALRTGRDRALGLSPVDIHEMIDALESPSNDDFSTNGDEDDDGLPVQPFQPDEQLGAPRVTADDLSPWTERLSQTEQTHNTALWNRLAEEDDSAALFNLLAAVRDSPDYQNFRTSLTQRVWRVMEAAGRRADLREELFSLAKTIPTCVDGRILSFSQLEMRVYVANALEGVNPTDLRLKGSALLDLSRKLFRLEQVEALARDNTGRQADPAEVRLKYLIGLQDKLDLPAIPHAMRFDKPITGKVATDAAAAIKSKEKTTAFHQNLILRDFWVEYLQERYPEDFAALEQRSNAAREAFENDHPDYTGEGYADAAAKLAERLQNDETNTRIAVSQRAETALRDPDQPGTSAELMGTPER